MHSNFARDVSAAVHLLPIVSDHDEIIARHLTLAHARGGYQDTLRIETHGDVAIRRDYKSAVIERFAGADNFLPMVSFRFHDDCESRASVIFASQRGLANALTIAPSAVMVLHSREAGNELSSKFRPVPVIILSEPAKTYSADPDLFVEPGERIEVYK